MDLLLLQHGHRSFSYLQDLLECTNNRLPERSVLLPEKHELAQFGKDLYVQEDFLQHYLDALSIAFTVGWTLSLDLSHAF